MEIKCYMRPDTGLYDVYVNGALLKEGIPGKEAVSLNIGTLAHLYEAWQMEEANRFWDTAKQRVERIAAKNGILLELDEHDDPFLYDLYSNGERIPPDEEVVEALMEVMV